jgi:hypothetical protein
VFVRHIGVWFKSPNKLIFGHCLFARLLSSVIRNQGHNVIIIHHCGGKQHEHEDIEAYINTLEIGNPLDAEKIKQGYEHFKHRHNKEALKIQNQVAPPLG